MTEEAPRTPHDPRCELVELAEYPGARAVCRCADRLDIRLVAREVGNRTAITDMLFTKGYEAGATAMTEVHGRMLRELYATATSEGRDVLPFTVHLVTWHDGGTDTVVVSVAALTLPTGAEVSRPAYEVAEDWMAARGLRTH